MVKNNKRRDKKRKGKRTNKTRSRGVNAPPRTVNSLTVRDNPVYPITRALIRNFSMDSSSIDSFSNTTMQITFAPGATDWRLDGTSIYQDSLPNLTEFTNLFDQWRLRSVTLRVDVPLGYSNSGATPVVYPDLFYISDYDDTSMASLSDIAQYPQMQIHSFLKNGYSPLMIKFSPKPLRDIAGAGVSTSYGPMTEAPWIRTANMITPHYGLKLAFNWYSYAQTTDIKMAFTVWYELEFTNPK